MTSLLRRGVGALDGFRRKWLKDRAASAFDRNYARLGPIAQRDDAPVILVEGMWDNPNHYFRLHMFLNAIPAAERGQIVAVLRSPRDRTRNTLEAFGIRRFAFLSHQRLEPFYSKADAMLAGCMSHADILNLPLPAGLPAYVFYDTALKLARHPQPQLAHPVWRKTLATQLRDIAFAQDLCERHAIGLAVLSHPWKSEYAALVWAALARNVPVYHLTAYCEALRIRRFDKQADYLVPVERLRWNEYRALSDSMQNALVEIGRRYLDDRAHGTQTDINAKMAYRQDLRIADRVAARAALADGTDRPVVLVSAHVWYDFPHSYGMRNFTDFKDWIETTLKVARRTPTAVWLFKPHPAEEWYGKFALASIAKDLPSHVRLLPVACDTATALLASDIVVTVHGTVAIEAAARGMRVLTADRSHFSEWRLATEALTRAAYETMLADIENLPFPPDDLSARAAAFAALTLAVPPPETDALRLSCDSSGSVLLEEIGTRLVKERGAMDREVGRIARFLAQRSADSYAIFNLVETLRAAEGQSPKEVLRPRTARQQT